MSVKARLGEMPIEEIVAGCRQRSWEGPVRAAGCLVVLAAGGAALVLVEVAFGRGWGVGEPARIILRLAIVLATIIVGVIVGSIRLVSSMYWDEWLRRSSPGLAAFKARLREGDRLVALVEHRHGSRPQGQGYCLVVEWRAVVATGESGVVVGSCMQQVVPGSATAFHEVVAGHFERRLGPAELAGLEQALGCFLDDAVAKRAAELARHKREGNRLRIGPPNVRAAWGLCEEARDLWLVRHEVEALEHLLRGGVAELPGMIDWRAWSPGAR